MSETMPPLEVVAGVISDPLGRVLVTQRPRGRSFAGAWEFPGGKRERGEAPRDALVRELREELGVEVRMASRLLLLSHRYPGAERAVRLDCWRVSGWANQPRGLDGQALRWCAPQDLGGLDLLEADRPLVTALCLPSLVVYEPDPVALERRLRVRPTGAGPRLAWLTTTAPSASVRAAASACGDRLYALDPALGAEGVIPVAGEGWAGDRARPAPVAPGALFGALIGSAAEAALARERGAAFLLVPDATLAAQTLEAIGAVGLPYYPNLAKGSGRPPAPRELLEPRPVPAGQLWWK